MGSDSWLGAELRHFLALEAVAREGSFGKAATALGYTQSAVSQQIAALERIGGHRLVDRPDGPFDSIELMRDPYVLVVQADAPLAERDAPPTLREIAELDLIGHKHCRTLKQMETSFRHPLRFVFLSDHNQTVQALVAAGVGRALVPQLTMDREDATTTFLDVPKLPP